MQGKAGCPYARRAFPGQTGTACWLPAAHPWPVISENCTSDLARSSGRWCTADSWHSACRTLRTARVQGGGGTGSEATHTGARALHTVRCLRCAGSQHAAILPATGPGIGCSDNLAGAPPTLALSDTTSLQARPHWCSPGGHRHTPPEQIMPVAQRVQGQHGPQQFGLESLW